MGHANSRNEHIFSESASRRDRIGQITLALVVPVLVMSVVFAARNAVASSAQATSANKDAAASTEACPASIISYWRLDETSGNVFADSIHGLDATCSGDACPSFAAGVANGALSFDGVDDGLTAPDSDLYDWTNNDSFSIELWAKTSSCVHRVFFGKHSFRANWELGCGLKSNLPSFELRDTVLKEGIRITGSTPITDSNWHHLVAVRDGQAKENRLYVDGVLDASTTYDYEGHFINDNQLTFGFHHDKYNVNAVIDEIAVYAEALTAAEIEQHYQQGLAGSGHCNTRPRASDASFVIDKDAVLELAFSYSDPDGPGPYTFTIVDPPDHGSLSGSGADRTYTPDAGYEGPDSFTWRVNDGVADSNLATVGILVASGAVNRAPVAESQTLVTKFNMSATVQLNYSDPDGGPGPYTITIIDGPDHGRLSGSGTERTYVPQTDHIGSDSFTWRVSDGISDSNDATVSIEVVNEPPSAESNQYSTEPNVPFDFQFHYLDPDEGPGPYTITIIDGPEHGSLSGVGTDYTYTPDTDYIGSDSFDWKVNDGSDDSNIATISVEITDQPAVNEPPVAESATYLTQLGEAIIITPEYTDPDDGPGPYTTVIVDSPQHGALSGTGLDRLYTPDPGFTGTDSFQWLISDGLNDSNVATTTIIVSEALYAYHLPVIMQNGLAPALPP